MNIVKKIITIILASAIIISCAAVTFADNISANDKIEQLIENGFPKSFFKNKDVFQIDKIYDFFSTSGSVRVEESTAGLSENLYPSKPYPLGEIPQGQMTLRINTILDLDKNNNNQIKRVVINIDYEWVMGRPLVCFDDAIAANWDSSVFGFNGSFVAYDNKKTVLSPNE